MVWLIALIAYFHLSWSATVKDPVYDELDGFDLVEALVRDGKLDSAEQELGRMPHALRYHALLGHLEMARERWLLAQKSYEKMAEAPDRHLYLARTHLKLRNWSECVNHFSTSGSLWSARETDVVGRSACEFRAGLWDKAWGTLGSGCAKFASFSVCREKVALALELSLTNQALTFALSDSEKRSTNEILALAELFYKKKASAEALLLVEMARIRAPLDVDANLTAAQIYFERGQLHSAVDAFERASRTDRKYARHVLELHRILGQFARAAYYEPLIPDESDRLRAKLATYVDGNKYPLIASMDSVLNRSALREDSEALYALAFSLVRQGQSDRPLRYLSRISKPELMEKSAILRKAILDGKREREVHPVSAQ